MTDPGPNDERVLILAPTGRDAALARVALMEAGLRPQVCPDGASLGRELAAGAGVTLMTHEALTPPMLAGLSAALSAQPPWSAPPLVILTSGGRATAQGRRRMEALESLGNATLLERPLRVSTLVSTVRVALQSRRRQYELRDHLAERARLEAALQAEYEKQYHIAEMFQRSLLNEPQPDAFPGMEVRTKYRAARAEADIGGDFFDAFALNGGQVALVVGDVSGKGLEAASRTVEVKYALRAFLREHPGPAQALDRLNDFLLDGQMLDGQPLSSFVCLVVGVLETESGSLLVANAGAESPLVLPVAGDALPVPGHGPPLGVTATADYAEEQVSLSPGDTVLFVTDGITEARRERDFFGYEGLVETAQRVGAQRATLEALSQAVIAAAAEFAGGRLGDDVCLLAVRVAGMPRLA